MSIAEMSSTGSEGECWAKERIDAKSKTMAMARTFRFIGSKLGRLREIIVSFESYQAEEQGGR
ncbi:MAG: hypothetical protein WA609_08690, partial [Terriglobales bacterium]